jgi:hypothetical protein
MNKKRNGIKFSRPAGCGQIFIFFQFGTAEAVEGEDLVAQKVLWALSY